ncbi:MAG TPA: tetratricopeptide repeat protein, partial [Bacteroidales bacterium]|nr:tetratricopeptide repeat protein [Bacteroidales bacterium]
LLSFAIEYKFFGLNPLVYHITNLLLHLINVLMVFRLLRMLKLDPVPAAIAALIWSIHPMRVESVAWVTERKDLLYSLFFLPSLIFYIKSIQVKEKHHFYTLLSISFFLLSLLSKIQAVVLPLCLLLIDYYFERPLKFNLIVRKIPYFVLALVIGLIGINFLKAESVVKFNDNLLPLSYRLMYGLYALSSYLVKFVYPFHLSALYPYSVGPGQNFPAIYYVNLLLLPLLAFAVFRSTKCTRIVAFGTLFFLVNVVFMLQILRAGTTYLSDRYTYMAYIGLSFLAGSAFQHLSSNKWLIRMAYAVVSIYLAVMVIGTRERCKIWYNEETLWTNVIKQYPGQHILPYLNRADFYKRTEHYDKSLQDYTIVNKLDPHEVKALVRLGLLKMYRKDYEGAVADYKKAIELKPGILDTYQNLGAIYCIQQKYDSAVAVTLRGIRRGPDFISFYTNLGYYYIEMDKWAEAEESFTACLAREPNDMGSNVGMALLAYHAGQPETAAKYLAKAEKLEPRMKKGMEGINQLEKAGYMYTGKVKQMLTGLFALAHAARPAR